MPTLQELKDYLGVDGEFNDSLIHSLSESARELVEGVLRYKIAKINPVPASVKNAIMFACAYMFSSREQADMKVLEQMLRSMLSSLRKEAF